MGIFSNNKINKNKVQLFVQCLVVVTQSDDDFSEEELETIDRYIEEHLHPLFAYGRATETA